METFWFFRLQAYDSAYNSDFRFSLGHKLSYDSDYDSDSDSVASENQPLPLHVLYNYSDLITYLPTLLVFPGVSKFFIKSPGELPTVAPFTLFSYSLISWVIYRLLHWKMWNPPLPPPKKKKMSANKNGSHFEHFWVCLQVFVLWGLAGMW